MMAREALLVLLLIMLPLPGLSNFTIEAPVWLDTSCNVNGTDSSFANNLTILLQALPGNMMNSSGFNNTSVEEVFGEALCRGDINNATVCRDCVQEASQRIQQECRHSEDAIIWYDYCQVRYSFQEFLSNSYSGKYPSWEIQENNVSDPARFLEYLSFLMKNLSGEPTKKSLFATGEVKFEGSATMYGLVQCTPSSDCTGCLSRAVKELLDSCHGRPGGMVLSENCNVRFELYSFYNASSNLLVYDKGNNQRTWIFIVVAAVAAVVLIAALFALLRWRRSGSDEDDERSQRTLLHELATPRGITVTREGNFVSTAEVPFMDLTTIREATDNFSDENKLGQGGFGTVYKGKLPDGKEIAVKRLARQSWQGLEEFKNEVILIAKLQHRNLVRLLGCAIEGDEKLLVYEFMPKRSLDTLIFNQQRRTELDWSTCNGIIVGIARGLLYLHEESRHKIIHRDLKPNNVLLDSEMVAKISDFGMARIFGENQNSANTRRVVGTYGYMAPEYAMEGLFSVKSDVFSFGVILLEIVSGHRNSRFYLTGLAQTLLAYAWQLWNEGKELEFVESSLLETGAVSEMVRYIHIGLLCVQEYPGDRPTMSSVVSLLGSELVALPQPKHPAVSVGRLAPLVDQSSSSDHPSVNHFTISDISPR